jgi:sulfur dioxygenase
MYFRMLHDASTGAMSYLLGDLDAGEAVLVDPRAEDVPVLAAMLAEHRLLARWTLRTHDHDDLLDDAARRRTQAAIGSLGAPVVDHARVPGHPLPFGDEFVEVLRTPGHTARCLSFRWRDRLFCGGLLSVDACPHQPRPALPRALWDSVTGMVFPMPAETLLFGGHARRGRATGTVLEERRWHPWFGDAGRDEFLARVATRPADASDATDPPGASRAADGTSPAPARPMEPRP